MNTRALAAAASIVCVTAIAVSCDKSPMTPSPSSLPPPEPTLTGVRIEGPSSVAPGETVQFRAIASQSDGSTRDVTQETSWQSSNLAVLQVSPTGMATGIARGAATIRGQFSGRGFGREVLVLPAGTYRLAGRVAESGLPVAGATVNATGGPDNLSSTTDFDGRYALYGVAGDVEVRASRDGYQPHGQRILITNNQTLNFELVQVRQLEIAGDYLLTITAGECDPRYRDHVLPDDARVRTYRVSVSQNGPRLQATLDMSGGNLFGTGKFSGRVLPDVASFTLYGPSDYYYNYGGLRIPDLGERLSGSQFLTISGDVTATSSDAGITGLLNGLLRIGEGPNPPGERIADCWSRAHRFVMAK